MNTTSIEWTTFTANPLKYRDAAGAVVWGCVHHSPGCQHCYSETLAKRYGRGGPFNVQTMRGLTPFLDAAEMHKMRTAKSVGGIPVAGSRCFIGDMTDIFGEWVSDELLNELFSNVLEIRTDVTWQILTKRADRMQRYLSWRWSDGRLPSRHIHVGVSCEDQQRADERIPLLLQTPAAVRFISAEPLLGPLDISKFLIAGDSANPTRALNTRGQTGSEATSADTSGPANMEAVAKNVRAIRQEADRPAVRTNLNWVIPGGESGNGARPLDVAWVRSIVQQCKAAGVACFVKQLGADPQFDEGCGDCDPCLAGQSCPYANVKLRLMLRNRKGGDIAEFPADLRVREFPAEGPA